MQIINRRAAIKSMSALAAGIVLARGNGWSTPPPGPHLSFTTLGCPDWSLRKVVDFAARNGYDSIELRGILREMNLPKAPDLRLENIPATRRMLADSGIKFTCLGSSAHLHDGDPIQRKNNLDEARQYIDLAARLDCPNIRVFPDVIPDGQSRGKTLELIIDGLRTLADHAKDSQVQILLEPNGDFARTDDLQYILQQVGHPGVGILWNVSFMWLTARESPALVYDKLKPYIRHTHIKDLKLINGKAEGVASYDVLLGEGDVPVAEAIRYLHQQQYAGSYCCEWEKFWYPGIRDPEIALKHFPKQVRIYLNQPIQ